MVRAIKDLFQNNQQAIQFISKQIKETGYTVKRRDGTKEVIELCRQAVFDEPILDELSEQVSPQF